MSSSAEVPDIVGSITNAIGLNRLWESDQQIDAEHRKSQQEAEPAHTVPTPLPRHTSDSAKADVAPVSIAKEREKEATGGQKDVDQEDGIQVKLRPQPKKRTGYEWPMPASVKTNHAKEKIDSAPTRDGEPNSYPTDENHETTVDGAPSKGPSFMASLIPFLTQQHDESPETAEEETEQAHSPAETQSTTSRPRPYSSASHHHPRPKARTRQYTMPTRLAHGSDESDTGKRTAARSRWVAATQGLRFPLRRRKTDKQVAATKGNEVMMSLMAAAPAATMMGTHLLPDERGHHRIPIVVELLKVTAPVL